ncbi:MAG: cytochrome ubiquinol oxidase subunit I [Acidimicrobiia bacterium]|nr:cytochrome ubiquinol oxidase subunit I [Acidimicrobiia bacterium]
MDALIAARWQFGITTVYHFLFVPLTIGLALVVAILETMWVRRRDPKYLRATKFWGRLFIINFAVGVVTGLVQEFQFGMNWSSYSRFVGDIFGAPLALDGLVAFFLESTFLGLWIFGWDRLSPRLHAACAWLVSVGTIVSAFWILAANAWMQNPVGYRINPATGRAELESFLDLVRNPMAWHHLGHTVLASILTAAVLMLAVSGWHLLRHPESPVFRLSAGLAVVLVLVAGVGSATTGHFQGQEVADRQPMKHAAVEAHWETEAPAAFSIVAIPSMDEGRNLFDIRIPRLLSILTDHSWSSEVRGINDLQAEYEEQFGPGDYRPPVGVVYWSFRAMVGVGFFLIALGGLGTWFLYRKRLHEVKSFHRIALLSLGLPFIANITGWVVTEMGRQPWAVYNVLLTRDSVSPIVSTAPVVVTLIGFTLLYGVLAVIDVYLMAKYARAGVGEETTPAEVGAGLAY